MAIVSYTNAVGRTLVGSGDPTANYYATTAGQKLGGTAGNDVLWSLADGVTLAGGAGDDTYIVWGASAAISELPGGGVDTVISHRPSFTLPDNVENLVVAEDGGTGLGNSGDNVLTATGTGSHTLNGGPGNDVLVGSPTGTERFVIARGEGNDAIVGFTPGQDVLELDGFAALTSFAAVQAAMRQVGSDTVLDLGAGQMAVLRGVLPAQLSARDFKLPFSTAGMRLTFDDEFNGPLSASPDGAGTTWRTRYEGGANDGRTLLTAKEEEYYSDPSVGVDPFSLSGGVLTITAAPAAASTANGMPYTSGALVTSRSFAQQYGYFEMRAQLPAGQGFWPSFWMLPADGSWPPELDVLEALGNDPSTMYASTHDGTSAAPTYATSTIHAAADLSQGFHTYGVLWDAATIRWYLDGNEVASTPTPASFNKPMYMLVNLGVGGPGSWPGAADGTTVGKMQVDYVRAYATAATTAVTGSAALPGALTLTGWGNQVAPGAGRYVVTGNGAGGLVQLGDGDQRVSLTGFQDTVRLGAGNHQVSLGGNANTVQVGVGASTIDAGGSYAKVAVGASLSGLTSVTAAGYGVSVGATGNGAVAVSGTLGNAQVTLLAGDHRVVLGGSGNSVSTTGGNATIQAGIGQGVVHAGSGNDTITVSGWNNLLDGGGGQNVLQGGSGLDTFVLEAAGTGFDRIGGFGLSNRDVLDLSRTLVGAALAKDLSNLGQFVTARQDKDGTTLLADVTGGHGTPGAFAMLVGVNTTVAGLVAAHAITVGSVRT